MQHPKTLLELLSPKQWWVEEKSFDIDKINYYETIFTIGNGYLGTRGTVEGSHTAAFPQTFLNGVFDHNDSAITHMVNLPNWVPLTIFANKERLSIQNCKILQFHRILDIKQGLLYRLTRFKDIKGNITRYESIRYASFSEQHLCEIKAMVTPENYSGVIDIHSEVDAHIFNLDRIPAYKNRFFDPEVKWHKWAKSKHLEHVITKSGDDNLYLETKTLDRPHNVGYASALNILNTKANMHGICDYEHTYQIAEVEGKRGQPIHFEKLVSIYSSRDVEKLELQQACVETLNKNEALGFNKRFVAHKQIWEQKWRDSDCQIIGDKAAQHALRFNIYHLLIAANPYDPRTNVGAKSMSGEGYKGHIFWDSEIFVLPFFIYTQPKTAKNLLLYRYHTLPGAKENAETTGYKGARFPWESADFGHEETPKWSADGLNRIWTGEEEIHITADVVRGGATYFNATLDIPFALKYAAPILIETARFWASRFEYNKKKDRYELNSVIGPDEFHEHVNNNVFTNWMAQWNLRKAIELCHWLQHRHPHKFEQLTNELKLKSTEINKWKKIIKKVHILYNPKTKLFEEFEGYFKLKNVPITQWDERNLPIFPEGYDDFNCGETMLVKQADVIALLYILADEFTDDIKKINYDYYEPRTMHSSSLSASIHAIMAIETRNTEKALQYFEYTSHIDLQDHKSSTEDGMHIASAGGTWQAVIMGFGGMRVKNRRLTFKPWLPQNWRAIHYKIKWHGCDLKVSVHKTTIEFFWESQCPNPITIKVVDKDIKLIPQKKIKVRFTPEKEQIKVEHS